MRIRALALTAALWSAGLATACAGAEPTAAEAPPRRGEIRILAVHPHDATAFTQGLLWHRGKLYESLGGYGRSRLREVELATGRVLREAALPHDQFGEGLALVGERLVQLTWREGVAHWWSLAEFEPLGVAHYAGEGWGLAFDGRALVQSDGSATLTVRSPDDLSVLRTVTVRRRDRLEAYLNELEWAEGFLYANLWQSDEIVRIDPDSGAVRAVFDASGLLDPAARESSDVLNGIAYDPESRRFFLTGKLWPQLFEVELIEPSP